jgi:hypothetical protein
MKVLRFAFLLLVFAELLHTVPGPWSNWQERTQLAVILETGKQLAHTPMLEITFLCLFCQGRPSAKSRQSDMYNSNLLMCKLPHQRNCLTGAPRCLV